METGSPTLYDALIGRTSHGSGRLRIAMQKTMANTD